jgi:hypothetical protein
MGIPRRVLLILLCAGLLIPTLLFLNRSCRQKSPSLQKPTPTPTPFLSRKPYDTARLFNGITLQSSIVATPADATSLALEADADSYTLNLELHLRVPKPATTWSELLAATPELEELLPHLDQLLTNATPSPDFASLFDHKEKRLKANLNELQRLLPLDTLYDCQTILNFHNPASSRSVLFIQALMNVNADGSDGDRNLPPEKPSDYYQPQTNYRWRKLTSHPNPHLLETEERLAASKEKLCSQTLKPLEKAALLSSETEAKATLEELKSFSFLDGSADPFIVLPSFMISGGEGKPQIGDYAVVIAGGTLYPAIVGDKGPNFKMGEASLRICKEINENATADSRPVDHPKVVYLVFPGTAEKPFGPPDYHHLTERCHELWKEFGGSEAAEWQEWESLEKPWPTPTPIMTPTPTPSPVSPTPSSAEVPAGPGASPASTGNLATSPISGTNTAATPTPGATNPLSTPPSH